MLERYGCCCCCCCHSLSHCCCSLPAHRYHYYCTISTAFTLSDHMMTMKSDCEKKKYRQHTPTFIARIFCCCCYLSDVVGILFQYSFGCLLLFVMLVYVMCYGLLYKCAMFDIERDRANQFGYRRCTKCFGCVFGCTSTSVSICHQFVSLSLARMNKKNRFYYWRFCLELLLLVLLSILRNAKWIQMLFVCA